MSSVDAGKAADGGQAPLCRQPFAYVSLSCRNAALALAARDGVSGTIRDPWMLLRVLVILPAYPPGLNQIAWQAHPPPSSPDVANLRRCSRAASCKKGEIVRRCMLAALERPERAETPLFPGRPPFSPPPDPLRHPRLGLRRGCAKRIIPARTTRSARSRAPPPI